MKKYIITLVAMCFFAGNGFSEENLPEFLPIQSKETLRAWMLERISFGSVWVYGDAILYGQSSVVSSFTSGTAGEVVKNLSIQEFDFNVTNTNDPVHVSGALYAENGDVLFYGYIRSRVVYDGHDYKFAIGQDFYFSMMDQIPLNVGYVNNARIVYRDQNGNVKWEESLSVYDGEVWFPTKYAGQNGELVLESGEKEVFYRLDNGVKSPGIPVEGELNFALENYQECKDRECVDSGRAIFQLHMEVADSNGDGEIEPPVFRIELTRPTSVNVTSWLSLKGGGREYPYEAWYRKVGDNVEVEILPSYNTNWFSVDLPPGEYIITPVLAGLKKEPDSPYDYGGEKG